MAQTVRSKAKKLKTHLKSRPGLTTKGKLKKGFRFAKGGRVVKTLKRRRR